MTFTDKLSAPFDPSRVSWRVGSTNADKSKGMALAYIDARDVMARLDDAVGPECWQDRYEVHGAKTICYLSILTSNGAWVTKADGAGDTDVEAEKGSISDAFKRAAVKWGIGRYLYDIASPWVEIEQRGRSYVIKASEHQKLERLLSSSAPPAQRGPTAFDMARQKIAAFTVQADLGQWWREHKDGLKRAVDDAEYQDLIALVRQRGEEIAPKSDAKKEAA